MAKLRLIVDTDIVIDALKGIKPAKDLFKSTHAIDIYCSILTRKELLAKSGLSDAERRHIIDILSFVKILKIDEDIHSKFNTLVKQYGNNPRLFADYIIAATAWSKNLPLLTRNKKHFSHIREIVLSPVYSVSK
jgi:predicted nucleic acid-binding protein